MMELYQDTHFLSTKAIMGDVSTTMTSPLRSRTAWTRLLLIVLLLNHAACFQVSIDPVGSISQACSPERRLDNDGRRRPTEILAVNAPDVSPQERNLGLGVLLTVPIAWGTFEPAVRYVYTIGVPALLFNVSYYMVAALPLLIAASLTSNDSEEKASSLRGGFELGTYLFVGNALQILGLQTVPADRAAFLLQLTTVFVPLLAGVLQQTNVSARVWIASWIALVGVGILGSDGNDAADQVVQISQGDGLVVGAAVAYSFHCLRLQEFASSTSAVRLAASKAVTETGWSAVLLLAVLALGPSMPGTFFGDNEQEVLKFATSLPSELENGVNLVPAVAATVWAGLVTVAYTIYAQTFGQRRVSALTANLIYTCQPIWTSLFAWILLNETLGPAGYLGGTIIGVAVLLVAWPDSSDP